MINLKLVTEVEQIKFSYCKKKSGAIFETHQVRLEFSYSSEYEKDGTSVKLTNTGKSVHISHFTQLATFIKIALLVYFALQFYQVLVKITNSHYQFRIMQTIIISIIKICSYRRH